MSTARAPAMRLAAGRPAAPGLVAGTIVHLPAPQLPAPVLAAAPPGRPAEEAARLEAALGRARGDLDRLLAALADEAAAVMELQLALAGDDALADPARAAIASGTPALAAWQAAVGGLAAEFDATGDEYLRARIADLEDLGARVAALLGGAAEEEPAPLPAGAVVVARDLPPSRFLAADWDGRGIALTEGSPTSHVAMLARARGVPMVAGCGAIDAADGTRALLDGAAGTLVLDPDPGEERRFAARCSTLRRSTSQPAATSPAAPGDGPVTTADGQAVSVMVNIADLGDIDGLDPAEADGIGLVRTELLFRSPAELADEDLQAAAYTRLLAWARGRPVTIRTVDAGGDKPVPGLTRGREDNPFMGLRGVRLSLARPELFSVQLRALLRAAAEGDLAVLVPMVTVPREMDAVRALAAAAAADLAARGARHRLPRFGMMVEVPAAALTLDLFSADFASIGSNDLTQYVMAAARDQARVAGLADAGAAAVLRLVAVAAEAAARRGLPLSLCGDAAADPALVPRYLAAGIRALSVAPAALAATRRAVAATDLSIPRDGP